MAYRNRNKRSFNKDSGTTSSNYAYRSIHKSLKYKGRDKQKQDTPVYTEYVLTYDVYRECGRFTPTSMFGDARLGYQFPLAYTYEECRDWEMDIRFDFTLSTRFAFYKYFKSPYLKDLQKLLELNDEDVLDRFDLIVIKYWKKFSNFEDTFNQFMVEKISVTPLYEFAMAHTITAFKNFSTIAAYWPDIISEALHRFITEHQDKYVPFTNFNALEYFYNCMVTLIEEVYSEVKKDTGGALWSDIYRYSWDPKVLDHHYTRLYTDDDITFYSNSIEAGDPYKWYLAQELLAYYERLDPSSNEIRYDKLEII